MSRTRRDSSGDATSGRYGPFQPMQGARRRAEAIQLESSAAANADKANSNYRKSVRNPSAVTTRSLNQSRTAARRGLTRGSSPSTPD